MIERYAAPTTNGLRTKIMLDKCGLEYSIRVMDIASKENKEPWFLELNPDGLVPVMIDPDGPGGEAVTMSQSLAILVYLAEKSGKFVQAGERERVAFWPALMNAATDIAPAVVSIFLIQRRAEGGDTAAAEKVFKDRFRGFITVWDRRFAGQKWYAGDDVTIADFALYPVFMRCRDVVPEITEGLPNVDRWVADMAAREGVSRGMDFEKPSSLSGGRAEGH